jgi:tetratricopeptide (TPR) repeat protein
MKPLLTLSILCVLSTPALAGLYCPGESFRELPADWRGFLPDHRALRAVAVPQLAGPLRDAHADATLKLEAAARSRALSADEAADLGALYVRLGKPQLALGVLRTAARLHPEHFRVAAHLGTAWQLAGDLEQAAAALEEAVRLAPEKSKAAEEYHLKLVRQRLKEGKTAGSAPDDLFGVRFVGESGKPEPGAIAAAERKKLPPNAVAIAQQLALWLPADGRLLWLLGELANAHGDVRTAANILDGCVTEFGMASADLRARRQLYRAAADAQEKTGHRRDAGIEFQSSRALVRTVDPARLPAVKPDGVNPLPWAAVADTEVGPRGKPAFLKYVEDLDGKQVVLTGFMTPAGNATAELTGFLLTENPVGCWFCEAPGPTRMLAVELADGRTTGPTRTAVKVTGTLRLNKDDPERFPFVVADAKVGPAD